MMKKVIFSQGKLFLVVNRGGLPVIMETGAPSKGFSDAHAIGCIEQNA